ncbi:flagellar biosynthetic protein FliR [Octadecabacter ascidiaceicola]|uniref:Flagellar biosynthesis protein FliR n=1 Tax=Octadecabacter ascidiaceicola TaxID=1655543 RepID=A0A238KC25_9RHOB|nr:flagellar biosynthetic protein FliR [Octadecabacter ascidiaceicola]SMX40370.1 flagellar biosynthesis protein FliR [Octadecabacter ascidiaceicola]
MIEVLAEISSISQDVLWAGFLVFMRVGAMMALLPAFGEQSVPTRVKLGLALAFTAIVAPAIPGLETVLTASQTIGLILAETLTGLFLGLMLRLFIFALQIAGSIAAQSTSLSQLFGGAGGDPLPAMGHVLVIGGLALASIMGLHVQIAEFMINSYNLVPMGNVIPSDVLTRAGVTEISRAFTLGFTLAAPFVISSLIYNVTLGVINKAMPQLMVAFVGAPAITAGGLVLLMLAAPLMLSIWVDAMGTFILDPFRGTR